MECNDYYEIKSFNDSLTGYFISVDIDFIFKNIFDYKNYKNDITIYIVIVYLNFTSIHS